MVLFYRVVPVIFTRGVGWRGCKHSVFFYDLRRRKSSQLIFVRVDPMIFTGVGGA